MTFPRIVIQPVSLPRGVIVFRKPVPLFGIMLERYSITAQAMRSPASPEGWLA